MATIDRYTKAYFVIMMNLLLMELYWTRNDTSWCISKCALEM